jgi:hypothetical protein
MSQVARVVTAVVSLGIWLATVTGVRAQDSVLLADKPAVGDEYHVSVRVELAGKLTLQGSNVAEPLRVSGQSRIDYDERVLELTSTGAPARMSRIYQDVHFERAVGARPQQQTLRPAVRRMVLVRNALGRYTFSPDGPLTAGELDLLRTDVLVPALAHLCPGRAVRPGDGWRSDDDAVRELTDLRQLDENLVTCQFDQVAMLQGKAQARITLKGWARGVNEDGPNRQELDGYFYFDLQARHLSYLYLNGVSILLDKDGKATGRVEGRFVLTRRSAAVPELSEPLLANAIPGPSNTLVLYEDTAVRFTYPRNWRVAGVRAGQIALEEASGNGVLLTLEPLSRTPTAVQFQAEVQKWLADQKSPVSRTRPPSPFSVAGGNAETFDIETALGRQPVFLLYHVLRQAPGGVTVAARSRPESALALTDDVNRIVRSLTLLRAPAPAIP